VNKSDRDNIIKTWLTEVASGILLPTVTEYVNFRDLVKDMKEYALVYPERNVLCADDPQGRCYGYTATTPHGQITQTWKISVANLRRTATGVERDCHRTLAGRQDLLRFIIGDDTRRIQVGSRWLWRGDRGPIRWRGAYCTVQSIRESSPGPNAIDWVRFLVDGETKVEVYADWAFLETWSPADSV